MSNLIAVRVVVVADWIRSRYVMAAQHVDTRHTAQLRTD